MGQIVVVQTPPALILTAVDRLVASNADGGLSPGASHVILLGEAAGRNLAVSNVIAMGAFALDAGLNKADHVGSIGIGVNAGTALINDASTAPTGDGSVVLIGVNAAAVVQTMSAAVVIGGGAAALYAGNVAGSLSNDVIIGNSACGNATGTGDLRDSVIIGQGAAFRGLGTNPPSAGLTTSVIIGNEAARNARGALSTSVIIGFQAGLGIANTAATSNNTIIGNAACNGMNLGNDNVVIGSSADIANTSTLADGEQNVVVGAGAVARGASNVILGFNAANAITGFGDNNIVIGCKGGAGLAGNIDNQLLIETNVGTRRGVMYGDLNAGNILFGLSTPAVNRDLPGTNIVKILNGTATGNPVGGGMFYATAGELRWRSSTGVDYLLTPQGSRGTFTVATLPAAALLAGQRAYVSDALAPAFGAAPVGGGAVFIPVFYNGAAWIVG